MVVLLSILVGAVIAYLAPSTVLWMKPGLRPAFAITMLFVGSLVRPEQIRAFAASPSRPLFGLAAQYTIMPLSAFAISLLFEDPTLRTGIVLVGCMPGAMASNVMTVLLRGDLVLSVAMTTIATLICPLVLAFWLPLLANTQIDVPVQAMIWNATWMVVIPVTIGILGRALCPTLPALWDRAATFIASLAIVLIILVVVASNRDSIATSGPQLFGCLIVLNFAGYGLAWLLSSALGWPVPQRRTLTIEVGMQNAGLGSVLALSHLGADGALPSALYTALCVITAALALPFQKLFRS